MEVWFLVGCDDDLFSAAPKVHLERFTENRRDTAERSGAEAGLVDDLFERAQIAFEDHLGAGAMIYLRKVFESVTMQAADAAGISTKQTNGWRKKFKPLLEEVDAATQIIPREFAANGYKLFGELSEVIHGDWGDAEALAKYELCRVLVLGIVTNVRNNQSMAQATASLWGGHVPTQVANGSAKP